jgi:hypothetical protein
MDLIPIFRVTVTSPNFSTSDIEVLTALSLNPVSLAMLAILGQQVFEPLALSASLTRTNFVVVLSPNDHTQFVASMLMTTAYSYKSGRSS